MILLINICEEELHAFEFVKPICDILDINNIKYSVKHYKEIDKRDLEKADKIIICGTSLKDNEFIKNIGKFYFIKKINKSVLGIRGGMQIIGLLFNGKINRMTEIGYFNETFVKEFLGLKDKKEVYHLHNNYIDFSLLIDFNVFCGNEFSQAVKHKEKGIYGVLFHPEVRNKDLIIKFCSL